MQSPVRSPAPLPGKGLLGSRGLGHQSRRHLHRGEVGEGVSGGYSLHHGTCFTGICPGHPAPRAACAPHSTCLPPPALEKMGCRERQSHTALQGSGVRELKELDEAEREGVKASLLVPAQGYGSSTRTGLLQRQQWLHWVSTELPLPEGGKPRHGAEESPCPACSG